MNADSFIKFIKIEDIYVDIAKDSETRLDTDNYEFDRSLPIEQNKNGIGLIKGNQGEM